MARILNRCVSDKVTASFDVPSEEQSTTEEPDNDKGQMI